MLLIVTLPNLNNFLTNQKFNQLNKIVEEVNIIRIKTQMLEFLSLLLVTAAFTISNAYSVEVDPALKDYSKVSGVSGNISSIGSDTMNNMMALWCEGFSKYYPNVKCQIEGKGSSTAPPALIQGTAQFGPMSRAMKSKEVDAFEKAFGYKPTAVKTSIDTLAVYVNKDNPLECLTIAQVDAIFSKNRFCGAADDLATWGDIGLAGAWVNKPISKYGRNSASGTYGYFKKKALCKGDYKDDVKEQPGSASVVHVLPKIYLEWVIAVLVIRHQE